MRLRLLMFRAERLVPALLLGLTAATVAAESETPQRSDERPRNVLLLTVDTLRPDALGWVDPSRSTPHIDRLAREGFAFPAAVAPVPLTLPSHATLLTGLEPDRHGVKENGQPLADRFETLPERFDAAGYRTAAFVSGYPLAALFGTAQGFAHYDDEVSEGAGAWLERRAPATTDAAVAWLAEAGEPWFLWVHYYDPHLPYDPPGGSRRAGDRGLYDAEVRLVDRAIGRLLEAVASAEKTGATSHGAARSGEVSAAAPITLLAADHGESLGEHDEASHGYFIYESTMRVPIVVHAPGLVAPGASPAPIRLVDVAPTVLELAGLPALPAVEGAPPDGVSFAPLLRGEELEIPPATLESLQPWSSYGWSPLRGLRKGDWKYIAAPRPELYHLGRDPDESENLVREHSTLATELAEAVGVAGPRPAATEPIDPDVAARLRSLGYLSSGPAAAEIPEGLADPKDQLALRDLLTEADAALEAGDLRRAVQLADQVLAEDPKNRFALSRSGLALLRAGFADRAVLRLRRVVELDPGQSESRTLLAEALTRTRAFDEAIHHWQELVAERPDDAQRWSQLGSTLGMAGRTDEAVTALEEALARDPASSDRRLRLAFAHFAAGAAERAAGLLEGLRDEENDFAHHGTLGVFQLRAERPDEALLSFGRSLPTHPDFAEGRFEWAAWAAARGDRATAERALREALEARPDLRPRAEGDPRLAPLLR